MAVRRVALIFDHKARPETTGVYVRRALGRLVEVEHVLPSELSRVPRAGFDLYLRVDDGLDRPLPDDLRPSAFWAIDTHLDFDRALAEALAVDWVFAAQRDGAERLRAAGISVRWLPLACDPEIHRRHEVPKRLDVAFVGNVFPGPRAELLRLLTRRRPASFVGNRYFDEMAETYSAARIVFNRSLRNDVNMRVFEAVACGSLLLTNDLAENGQNELFRPGTHLETYRDADELLDKTAFYLEREEARERIAAAGMAEAHARHTYLRRMETLLAAVEETSSRTTVAPRFSPAPQASIGDAGPAGFDPAYFDHARPELLELIPRSARRVLDVGCGAGRLGEALKARQGAEVVGVERNPVAARAAAERLDRVAVGDVEDFEPDPSNDGFDAVVCGDVLEHLREPERLLRRAREWLRPGGRLVASIPNVRHRSVVGSLLEGNWTYEPAGLLDRDHVRFFTRREIEKMFRRAGFAIERLAATPGPGHREWLDMGRPGSVRIGRLDVKGLRPEEAEEFHIYQYLVAAAPDPPPDRGLTSIVILTRNQLAHTRECLESVRLRTDEPYELIVVDNGSTDGTVEYLRSSPDVRLIENAENRGFAAANNQGLAVATGRRVLLLNNDTVATTGWLARMLDVLESDPTIGLVGPSTNHAGGVQQIPVPYEDPADLDGFAWDWGEAHRGAVEETDRLIGFCLLIRREALEQIGPLDERFGIGCYEDDDYCVRARLAGWRTVIARDAFVHHYGSRTFLGEGIDLAAVMRENESKFRAKWSAGESPPGRAASPSPASVPISAHAPPPRPEYALDGPSSGGLLLRRKHARLSLCMIVRDNAGTIRPCLESVRPWVDEMVVVDTGSVDDTPAIVEEYGARLFRFPWRDDFSAARNESFRHATGEWLFWMDSDDTIEPECGRRLRELVYGPHDPAVLGYVAQVHCPGPGEDGGFDVTAVDHVKLVRNRPDLRFEGRIHEQLLPAIRRADGEVAWTDLYVIHSGSDHTPEGRERKIRRDLGLLNLELAERPEHPFTLFNLGMTYADCDRYEEAVDHLRRSVRASGPGESHLRKAYALLVHSQMRLGRREEARETLREGRRHFPEDVELLFRQGVLLHELGCLEESARAYRAALATAEERHFSSVDRGIAGFKARQNLAVALVEAGDLDGAEEQWRRIVEEEPRYRTGWRGLGETLLRRGDVRGARELVLRIEAEPGLEAEAHVLAARIAAAEGDAGGARRRFETALRDRPDDIEIRHDYCRLLFELGDPAEAEPTLRDLIRLKPDDASAHHNLGTVLLRSKRYKEAVEAYRASLERRPDHAATHLRLGQALKECGRRREAVSAWEEALRLDPADAEARAELEGIGAGAGSIASPSRRPST